MHFQNMASTNLEVGAVGKTDTVERRILEPKSGHEKDTEGRAVAGETREEARRLHRISENHDSEQQGVQEAHMMQAGSCYPCGASTQL